MLGVTDEDELFVLHDGLDSTAIESGYGYGFDIMTITGLASGTVYLMALRRLENADFVASCPATGYATNL